MSPAELECLQKHLPELPSLANISLGNHGDILHIAPLHELCAEYLD